MQAITNGVSLLRSGHFQLRMEDHLHNNLRNTKRTACTMLETAGSTLETLLPFVDKTSHHVVQKTQHTSGWVPYFLIRERR